MVRVSCRRRFLVETALYREADAAAGPGVKTLLTQG